LIWRIQLVELINQALAILIELFFTDLSTVGYDHLFFTFCEEELHKT